MPPFYPDQYQDQYPQQYPYNGSYPNQHNQYQYPPSPQGRPQFPQIQVNVPPRQQNYAPPSQPQYNYHQNFTPNYMMPPSQQQYQYQNQSQFPTQYQQLPHQQSHQHQHQHQHQQQQFQQQQQQQQQTPQALQAPQPQHQPQSHHQHQPYYQPTPQQVRAQPSPRQQQPQQLQRPQQPQQPQQPPKIQGPPPQVFRDVRPPPPPQKPVAIKSEPLPKIEPDSQEPDYEILLLSLADEYLEAAQKLPVRSADYFKLTATALGCIEAALNNFKLQPLREAQVTLRYAQLMFNETDNNDDAERMLTKTVDLCERLKYHDLRYAAQLLLIRILHRSRPKAALKDLQGMIQDIEAYKHTAWEYAFRLQHVMFSVASGQPNDLHTAAGQLERISHLARQSGDHVVLAFAAVLEALVHLQTPALESFQSSQRALAKARALQLNPEVAESPQICLMMELVDLAGHIKNSDVAQCEQKRKTLHQAIYPALQNSGWRSDGLMYVPINQSSLRGLSTQDSGLIAERNGKFYLAISWLTKGEIEELGYMLSGISAASKNAGDGGKAEKFLSEGLELVREVLAEKRSINNAGDILDTRQRLMECHFLLEIAFLQCSKGQWRKAQATMKEADNAARIAGDSFPSEMMCTSDYIKGSIYQGMGNLDAALRLFQSPSLNIMTQIDGNGPTPIKSPAQAQRRNETIRSLSILAAMNTIFIIQQPNNPQHGLLHTLVNAVDPPASHHTNKTIQAAWNFVLASLPNNTILKTKQYLGTALKAAQGISNAQITTLCLVTMQDKFFKGVVGDQAVKCAKAASHQAKKLNEPMWIAVAGGLEAECLDVHGMREESVSKRDEVDRAMRMLPDQVNKSVVLS